ncbi:hypothetical protein EV714DRAFT_273150 [Schizophyllum commune]
MATISDDSDATRLPQELIDAIICALNSSPDEDPAVRQRTLRACAVAHSSLLQRCQQYLFRDITLIVPSHRVVDAPTWTPTQKLRDVLMRSPHLADYVRVLRIEERLTPVKKLHGEIEWGEPYGAARETGLVQLLHILPELEHLAFTGHMRDRVLPSALGQAFAIPPALHTLELAVVSAPLLLLQEMRLLQNLQTRSVRWLTPEISATSHSHERPTIRELELHQSTLPRWPSIPVGGDAESPIDLSALCSFSVTMGIDMSPVVHHLIRTCRATLTKLEVWPTDSPTLPVRDLSPMPVLPLGELSVLEELVIRSPTGVTAANTRSMWNWVLASLSELHARKSLTTLALIIDISYHSSHALGTMHFTELDRTLSRISSQLRSVTLRINRSTLLRWITKDDFRARLEECFPLVAPLGILWLDVPDPQ